MNEKIKFYFKLNSNYYMKTTKLKTGLRSNKSCWQLGQHLSLVHGKLLVGSISRIRVPWLLLFKSFSYLKQDFKKVFQVYYVSQASELILSTQNLPTKGILEDPDYQSHNVHEVYLNISFLPCLILDGGYISWGSQEAFKS